MMSFVITIHVIACVLLITIVLVQRGRGGGFVENLSSLESVFGTKTSVFLTKATTVSAVVFFITCLFLAVLSVQKSKSLVQGYRTEPRAVAKPISSEKAVEAVDKAAAEATVQADAVKEDVKAAAETVAVQAPEGQASQAAAQPVVNKPVEKARTAPLPRQGEVK